jgi:hypothetical protein
MPIVYNCNSSNVEDVEVFAVGRTVSLSSAKYWAKVIETINQALDQKNKGNSAIWPSVVRKR